MDIIEYHQTRPFEPFDIRLSDGRVHTVDHPEFWAMSRKGSVIYFSTEDVRFRVISISQITTIEKTKSTRAE